MMKHFVTASIITSGLLMVGIVIYSFSFSSTPQTIPTVTQSHSSQSPAPKEYTLQEINKHSILSNCWIAVSGSVYDISGFSAAHPGGTDPIASSCGTDATTAFATRGGQGESHSREARSLLQTFYIGILKK